MVTVKVGKAVSEDIITIKEVHNIPQEKLPAICFCNGFTSLFGMLISLRTNEYYNHFMMLTSPHEFASQWWWYKKFPVEHFSKHAIKIVWNRDWTDVQRKVILQSVENRMKEGPWKTRYDILGVIGQAIGIPSIQNKKLDYCSETIKHIALVDPECAKFLDSEPHPRPEEINDWVKTQSGYRTLARVVPE